MNLLKNIASELLDDQEDFSDLTQVAVVDEMACLNVLKKRLASEPARIYTHCGPLLVAVNPYQVIPELYSEDQLQEYSQLIPAEGPPAPHAFEMAARAYTKMMAQACTQPRATGLRQTAS